MADQLRKQKSQLKQSLSSMIVHQPWVPRHCLDFCRPDMVGPFQFGCRRSDRRKGKVIACLPMPLSLFLATVFQLGKT